MGDVELFSGAEWYHQKTPRQKLILFLRQSIYVIKHLKLFENFVFLACCLIKKIASSTRARRQ